MKFNRFFEALPVVAALLLTTSCSNDINEIEDIQLDSVVKTIPYSVTVSSDVSTRATLNDPQNAYVFETGDVLYVQNGDGTVYGALTLDPEDAGKTTGAKFNGSLSYSSEPAADLALTATLVSSSAEGFTISGNKITGQDNPTTLATTPEEAVSKYSVFRGNSTYGAQSFTLSQYTSFLSFDITLTDGTADGTELVTKIIQGATILRQSTITTATEDGKVKAKFVAAFPGGTELNDAYIQLGSKRAIPFGGSSTTLTKNYFYRVKKGLVDLSTLTADYTAQNGDIIFGTLVSKRKISIANNATVTLAGASINADRGWYGDEDDYSKGRKIAGLTCAGSANIILSAGTTNRVKGYIDEYPGIEVPSGKTLTIKGTGTLYAESGEAADNYGASAGIGGSENKDCGNIIIEDGTIYASAENSSSAAIGSGQGHSCGNIKIEGGTVTAENCGGAGIGSGSQGSCGTITISSGTVFATGAMNSAGIGCGDQGSCGVITLSGGNITATTLMGGSAASIGTGRSTSSITSICTEVNIPSGVNSLTMTNGSETGKITNFINASTITIAGQDFQTTVIPVYGDNVVAANALIGTKFNTSYDSHTWSISKKATE